ncbi:hypothetical protein PROAA_230010 [Candidatus Propionivibrio aalborgensis]|uniref:Uncharacterized protein n=1 Tax=Candidatus Propionivibrio aalborgensis TaxID=1860101 RepID=A0A1A8XT31_9RHOO|nr:hypothetical protein PROAA_230010 [Candidatus Propionivibrio aalborgensis]
MKRQLQRYVGRIVRLNKRAYQGIKAKAIRRDHALENCFVVAGISLGVQLICYGANSRIVVDIADVSLV